MKCSLMATLCDANVARTENVDNNSHVTRTENTDNNINVAFPRSDCRQG